MSLDFELYVMVDTGAEELQEFTLLDLNITHNLGRMASEAGIYYCLWRPEELDILTAAGLIDSLTLGIKKLESDPAKYERLNPPNGWGSYETLLRFAKEVLFASETHPKCLISTCR